MSQVDIQPKSPSFNFFHKLVDFPLPVKRASMDQTIRSGNQDAAILQVGGTARFGSDSRAPKACLNLINLFTMISFTFLLFFAIFFGNEHQNFVWGPRLKKKEVSLDRL